MSINPKNILIIEDDESIRDSLQEILEIEGHHVVTAENGKVALDYLLSLTKYPDLIFLDLMMPIMDGYQFRKEQQNNKQFSHIPVVIMSAHGHMKKMSEQVEAKAYLGKPVDMDDIILAVTNHAS